MYCSKCGANIDGMNFCPNCGQKVEQDTQEREEISKDAVLEDDENIHGMDSVKKNLIFAICGGVVAVLALVFIFMRKEPMEITKFDFCGYEVGMPDIFTYNEEISVDDQYAVFENEDGEEARIDILYAGKGYSPEDMEPVEFINQLYDYYKVDQNFRLGVLGGEGEVKPIAGMYTVSGRILMPEAGIWNVYVCINDDSELFYFVLMNDSEDMVENFQEAMYETVETL